VHVAAVSQLLSLPFLQVPVTLPRTGFFISKTEVPAFIPRDDMMDQILRWALIEAEEGGQRNFGMPMKVRSLASKPSCSCGSAACRMLHCQVALQGGCRSKCVST
jgi:hypothetical protein